MTAGRQPCVQAYLERLGIWSGVVPPPTEATLRSIAVAHLATVPFENLDAHCPGRRIVLTLEALEEKIVRRRRGGVCFELNGLLAEVLLKLGFGVRRLAAHVFRPDGFKPQSTHIMLLVEPHDADGRRFLVDVGFGEPPLEPLLFELDGRTQRTSDGMQSRLRVTDTLPGKEFPVQESGREAYVLVEWEQDGAWCPRLTFTLAAAQSVEPGLQLGDFQDCCDHQIFRESIFTEKLIACRLTATEKVTLAGTRLKVTAPRFGGTQTVTNLLPQGSTHGEAASGDCDENHDKMAGVEAVTEAVRKALQEHFGISYAESHGLDLGRSLQADPQVWAQL